MIEEPTLPGQDEESIALERSILGRLLIHPEKLYEVTDALTPQTFYGDSHRIIFEVMLEMAHDRKEITCFSVHEQCRRQGYDRLDGDSSLNVILALTNYDPWYNSLGADAKVLKTRTFQRDLIFKAPAIAYIGHEGGTIPEMLAKAQAELDALKTHSRSKDIPLSEIMCDVRAEIDAAYDRKDEQRGIPTGLYKLNLAMGKLQPKQLILLAARPSMGKSALAFQIGHYAAHQGHEVATYSLEMGARDIGFRYLSLETAIPMRRLKKGLLHEDEWANVVEAYDTLAGLPLTINDTSGMPVSSIRDALMQRQAERGRPAELVIVDYLQLMEPESIVHSRSDRNRVQEIDQISRGLKGIAKDFNVPVLACAQLSRAVEARSDKRPQLSDLRESGGLEQDGDIIIGIYRDDYYHRPDEGGQTTSERPNTADVTILKNRNDMTGELVFRWNGPLTRFEDM